MRKKVDRSNHILEILTERHKIDVTELAVLLGVSQVTARKDLDDLESRGILKREHGYAVLQNTEDLNTRIGFHYDVKHKIALRASELVQDGDTIMIENGSCCAVFAEILTRSHSELTIVTNSAFIAGYLRGKTNFQIILLGGIYQQESQCMVGPMIGLCAESYNVDLFFIGTDGYSPKTGFANRDQMRAQAIRDMAAQSESVVILTESGKFDHHGIVPLHLHNRQTVITDTGISDFMIQKLEEKQIEVITVEKG